MYKRVSVRIITQGIAIFFKAADAEPCKKINVLKAVF